MFNFRKRLQSVDKRFSVISEVPSLTSQQIIDIMNPDDGPLDMILDGICRGEPLSDRGKRLKVLKILSVTLLPILSLWAFTVYSLSDSIQGKFDIEQTQYAVKFSVEIGMFLDRLQRERDMSVLYLSILGPETKTFLMNEYLLTDQALDHLSDWPVGNDHSDIFQSKESFNQFLREHRQNLDPSNYDIYVEMDFYSFLIERFIEWMYGAIKESNMASIWKILVAYQKIVTVMEHIGIERALGTVFYVEAGFPERVYERYNNRVNIFKANYRSAVLYSDAVDPIYQGGVTASGTNLTAVIESFRFEIQHVMQTEASITKEEWWGSYWFGYRYSDLYFDMRTLGHIILAFRKSEQPTLRMYPVGLEVPSALYGQWWFDNMTLYLDTLLIIQQELAFLINGQLEEIIQTEEQNLTISACFLVIVFLMCPLVIYSVQTLTSDIQRFAKALVHKTKELSKEKKQVKEILFQMVPPSVGELLSNKSGVNSEYYKAASVMLWDTKGLTKLSPKISATETIDLLTRLYAKMDKRIQAHEVYKVESINDSCMVVSGIPIRRGNRHSAELADLALELLHMVDSHPWTINSANAGMYRVKVQLRIGISTGPCMAGVLGTAIPRYRVFGNTINIASRMKSYGLPNKIQIHLSTFNALRKHGDYIMSLRGTIETKSRASLTTYWLLGKSGADGYPRDVPAPADLAEMVSEQANVTIPRDVPAQTDRPEATEARDSDDESVDDTLPSNFGKFGTFEISRPVKIGPWPSEEEEPEVDVDQQVLVTQERGTEPSHLPNKPSELGRSVGVSRTPGDGMMAMTSDSLRGPTEKVSDATVASADRVGAGSIVQHDVKTDGSEADSIVQRGVRELRLQSKEHEEGSGDRTKSPEESTEKGGQNSLDVVVEKRVGSDAGCERVEKNDGRNERVDVDEVTYDSVVGTTIEPEGNANLLQAYMSQSEY